LRIYRTSKRKEAYLAGRFKFVPDPNIVCTKRFSGIGSEARTKSWSYGKKENS
tara:strand:+ start:198 stop:356 length:159 start_codon:yes stop_codon:yes gene_type:complete